MATKRVKVRGIANWAKVFEPNRDFTGYKDALKDSGGQTVIDLHMDEDNINKLMATGSGKVPKPSQDYDGKQVVKFTRPWQHPKFDWAGGAPEVVHADGTKWDIDDDGLIGNGSIVDVVADVYPAGDKTGTRMRKVIVVEHVPYAPTVNDELPETAMEDEIPF